MKGLWYFIKSALVPFMYLIFVAIIALGIITISDELLALKIIFSILNIALFALVVGTTSYRDGQTALKVRIANDLERMQIIKTGEERPLKLAQEYKPWKGFVIGLLACIPCVILLIIHTIMIFSAGMDQTGAGAICGFIYMLFFSLVRLVLEAGAPSPYLFYFSSICLVFVPLFTGIPYIIGAKRVERQQEKIRQRQREIYGE